MKIKPGSLFLTAIAAGVGLVTLLGYFLNNPILLALRLVFVAWASTLAALALWIGVGNLLAVHGRRAVSGAPGWFHSLFLALALVLTLGAGLAAPFLKLGSGPANQANLWLFRNVQMPVAASLSAALLFYLVFAGYRILRRPPTLTSVVFILTAIVALIGMAPVPAGWPDLGLRNVWLWLSQAPAVAGARGLLLGLGLGIVATGLRVLLGVDRPYGE